MKVLVANDLHGRTSAAGVAVRMAEGLAARGHQVGFLATTQDPSQARRDDEGGVAVRVVHTPRYPLRFKSWRTVKPGGSGAAAMAEIVQELRPDVVHVHNLHIHLGYPALEAAHRAGAKVVLHVHDVMPFCHQKLFCHLDERLRPGDEVVYQAGPVKCALCVKGRYNPFRNRAIRRTIEHSVDRLLAVSDEMSRALAANDLTAHGVVPNGLPPLEPASPEAQQALSERLGIAGRPVVLHGGRLDRLKGSLELVRALEIVLRRLPDAVLLMVGEALPGFRDELVSLAARLGLPERALAFAGWLSGEELAAAYELADVVASPSLCFESFGLVNLEAMGRGKPVVASFWGGPSDVIVDGETGFLVNPLHVDVMADRLARILADPVRAAAMGAAGRRRAEEVFGPGRQLDLVEAVYRELLP